MSNNTEDKSGANIRKSVSEEEIKLFKRALTEAVSAQIDKAIEESKDIDKAKNQWISRPPQRTQTKEMKLGIQIAIETLTK